MTATVPAPEAPAETAHETKRDRVRRLLIDPLSRDGMRFRREVTADEARKRLDRLADDLAYLSDLSLERLRLCLRTKGEGSAKCFWPSRVTVLGFAEVAQPRPLRDLPGVLSWFTSVAGSEALKVPGRLLAEAEFWTRHKRPPMTDQERRNIRTRAGDLAARMERLTDREARDALTDLDDRAWLAGMRNRELELRGWVEGKTGGAG